MTSNVTPLFSFGDRKLRAELIGGEPWFAAPDACRILDLDVAHGTHRPLSKLASDEKCLLKRADHPSLFEGSPAPALSKLRDRIERGARNSADHRRSELRFLPQAPDAARKVR